MTFSRRYINDPRLRAAHQILDDARAGVPTTHAQITWALRITGDLT